MSFFIGSYYLGAIITCNMSISGDDAIIGVNALLMGGRSIQFTPVKQSGGDRRDGHPSSRADAEIVDVPDVDGYVSGLNRSLFPPSERIDSTQKRKRGGFHRLNHSTDNE